MILYGIYSTKLANGSDRFRLAANWTNLAQDCIEVNARSGSMVDISERIRNCRCFSLLPEDFTSISGTSNAMFWDRTLSPNTSNICRSMSKPFIGLNSVILRYLFHNKAHLLLVKVLHDICNLLVSSHHGDSDNNAYHHRGTRTHWHMR